jgi:predicted nucleic acid-binding protein
MRTTVLDASALGALVFGEPEAEDIAGRLSDTRIIAPALLWFEVANICIKKMKAYPHLRARFEDAFVFARKMPIEIGDVNYPDQ